MVCARGETPVFSLKDLYHKLESTLCINTDRAPYENTILADTYHYSSARSCMSLNKTNLKMDSRDILIGRINDGLDTTPTGDNSNKSILSRGCDPEMGRRAMKLLPPLLGHPEMVSVTNDDDFITELQRQKWSVIFFAPGACRYDATKLPIPGSRSITKGWGLAEYRDLVRKHQGEGVNIVETTDERQIVPLLRKALENNTEAK